MTKLHRSIHLKLFVMVTIILTLVLFGGFSYAIKVETMRLNASIRQSGYVLSEVLRSTAGRAFIEMDEGRVLIDRISSEIIERGEVLGIEIHCPQIGIISRTAAGGFVFEGDEGLIEDTYQKGVPLTSIHPATGILYSYVPIKADDVVEGVIVFAARAGAGLSDLDTILHERYEHIYLADIHGNMRSLKKMVLEMGEMEGVLHLMIYDANGIAMASSEKKCDPVDCTRYVKQVMNAGDPIEVESPEAGADYIFKPIMIETDSGVKKIAGVVELAMDLHLSGQKIASLRRNMIATGVATLLLLSGMLGFFVHRIILRPIRKLKAMADAVAEGDMDKRLTLHTSDEFSILAGSFNRMLDDIQRSHNEITASHDYLDRILSYMNEAVIVFTPSGRVGAANTSAHSMTGYRLDEIYSLSINDLFSGAGFSETSNIKDVCRFDDMTIRRKDGGLVPVDISCAPMKDETAYILVIQDNTERRKAEEKLRLSEEKFSKAFHASPDWILISRIKDGYLIECNEAFLKATGYEKDEALGKTTVELGVWQSIEAREDFRRAIIDSGRIRDYEIVFAAHGGDRRILLLSSDKINIGDEECILTIGRDITKRKSNEENIKAALREKEVLLREVHHRVKNNLQVIQSLLSMQAMHVDDEVTSRAFRESQDRVRSMALIHERFYRSKELSRIDFGEYARELIRHMISSYSHRNSRISSRIDIQDIMLTINYAIPCGIIINEIVSNSMKYAFPHGIEGEIFVGMLDNGDGTITMTVGDNGVGVSGDLDISGEKTLGLSLVRILAHDQLDGKLSISTEKGVVFKVDFAVT